MDYVVIAPSLPHSHRRLREQEMKSWTAFHIRLLFNTFLKKKIISSGAVSETDVKGGAGLPAGVGVPVSDRFLQCMG